MELNRALEIFEYNKAMLTCDMSISRDPEHQEVSPDYYGKDAEDLYYAIVFIEKYIDNSIPIAWIKKYIAEEGIYPNRELLSVEQADAIERMIENWEKENETN